MHGTPLPSSFEGVVETRPITIDRSLFYLIGGALEKLADYEPLEQTGALTVAQAREALGEMLWNFYHEAVPVDSTPIGAIMMWPNTTAPDNWLICDGTSYERADYPDLYDALNAVFHTDADNFTVPDMRRRFPYGVETGLVTIGETGGQSQVTLSNGEMPRHSHALEGSNGVDLRVANGGVTSVAAGLNPGGIFVTGAAIPLKTMLEGGTDTGTVPHENKPPWLGLNFIVRAL